MCDVTAVLIIKVVSTYHNVGRHYVKKNMSTTLKQLGIIGPFEKNTYFRLISS